MRNIDDILNSLTPEQQALLALRLRKKRQGQHNGDTILPRKNKSVHPMSYAQKRMWFLDQLDQQSHIYNISAPLRIVGPLDVPALQKTFAAIIHRHATLCSFFQTVDGEPVQVVLDEFAFGFELIDLRHVPADQQEDTVRRLATLESRRPFDLSASPPIRASLLELNSEMHVLLFSVHHIAFDGWSTNLLLQELQACYSGFVSGHATTLPELPIQYTDYAEWQSNRLTGEYLEQQLSFWKQSLEGVPELLDLPLDQPRRHSQSHKGAHYPFEVPSADLGKLKEIARSEGATAYMILLAAFQAFLFRYTGQECIAIGTPIANRTRVELERLIGFFVNTLVMRADIRGDLSLREVLRGTRDFALQAYKHQELPFDLLVDALHVKRDPRCSPLFQVMFDVLESPLKNVRMHDLDFSLLEVETGSSKFDLTLTFSEEPDKLRGMFEYNTDLFYETTIQRMAGQFRMLLASITAHPDRPIATLPLLPEAERHQVLVEWNATDEAFATGLCAHQLIESAVRRTPDALAVKSGERYLTYRELNEKANRLARYLRSCGVGPEVIVGVCVTRSPEMIVGMLAVLKAGGAYLLMDASYPLERLAFMCEDSGMKVLLTQESISQALPTRGIITLHLDSINERISLQSADDPVNITSPQNLAYVIYTSGSTGKPKGVLLQHEGLVNVVQCHIRKYGVTEADRAAQIASAGFDASVLEIFPYLVAGASLHIADDATRSIPTDLLEWFVSNKMTRSFVPTPMVEMMLDLAWPPDTSLRAIVVGGDALHRRPDASLPFKLINHYGPTENTVLTTETIVSPRGNGVASRPFGKPISNIQV